jgi:tripartite-type tricarboxylate transporter receptor subunit TctC
MAGGSRQVALAALAAASLAFQTFAADPYPTKPVRVVVAAGPGGTDDIAARIVTARMSELLGQQFYVENRPGAGGSIAQTFVMRSPPDGYTLLIAGGSMAGARFANANVTYDVLNDFTPISLLGTNAFVLVVNPALPVKDVKELIAHAKANPGKLSHGTIGAGQIPYWSVTLFNTMAGIKVLEVPYKATADVLSDVIAGRVDYYISGVGSILPLKDKLRVLGVTTSTRDVALPEVPSISETLPGYDMPAWVSMMGPAKMQLEQVQLLSKTIAQSLATPEVRDRYLKAGFIATPSTPEGLRQRYEYWMGVFGKIAKDVGLKPQ